MNASLGDQLKSLRSTAKLTQDDIAYAANISKRQYQRIEADVSVPTLETLFSVASALGIDPLALIEKRLRQWQRENADRLK